jgi:hypothetical protein
MSFPHACVLACAAQPSHALRLAGASASRPKRAYAPECYGTQVRRTSACRHVLGGLPAAPKLCFGQAGNPDSAFWTPDKDIRG